MDPTQRKFGSLIKGLDSRGVKFMNYLIIQNDFVTNFIEG